MSDYSPNRIRSSAGCQSREHETHKQSQRPQWIGGNKEGPSNDLADGCRGQERRRTDAEHATHRADSNQSENIEREIANPRAGEPTVDHRHGGREQKSRHDRNQPAADGPHRTPYEFL
jgi:hypothetical protein